MDEHRPDGLAESMKTYASRLARLCFLHHRCSDDHPVLLTELELVEMARSRLQEQAMARYGSGLPREAPRLAVTLRRMASKWVDCSVEDDEERDHVLRRLELEDLSGIFRKAS